MRVPSGVTDQYIYFVGVDSTDFATRETGLSSFTVYRSRNGGASSVMTTPTINETDSTNLAGVYELLLDEDMTIGSGNDSEEMVFHITHAGMSPVTRTIELYRPKITVGNTLDVTATGAAGIDWGNIENKTTANDLSGTDIQLVDTVTTYTGNTKQTADNNVLAAGATGFAAIDTVVDAIKAITDQFAFTVANVVDSNALAISGDTVAADNLEAMYDGTGLTGDTYPAKQSQVTNISNVGAAVHKQFTGETLTTPATATAGSYASTEELDSTYLDFSSVSGGLNVELLANIGGGSPESLEITGYITGPNDAIRVQAYNGAAWKTIGTWQGSSSTSNQTKVFNMFSNYVDTGANLGGIRIRFYNDNGTIDTALTSADIKIDQAFIAYAQGSEGYSGGAIWYDTSKTNTGTVHEIDGVATNPVSSEAAVVTLLSDTNLHRIHIGPASTFTLATSHDNQIFEGHEWALELGSQSVAASMFIDASVSGTGTGAESEWETCIFAITSLPAMQAYNCSFTAATSGGFTMSAAGDYRFINCQSGVAGSGSPLFTLGTGAITAEFRRWSGGIAFAGLTSDDTITISGELGTIDLGSPASAVTVEVRGTYKAITNIGSASVNIDGAIKGADVASTLALTSKIPLSDGSISWNATAIAAIKAEVDAALATTTYAEPGAIPAATASLEDKISFLYTLARNKITQTATTSTLRNDADSGNIGTSTVSDDATTATRGEWG